MPPNENRKQNKLLFLLTIVCVALVIKSLRYCFFTISAYGTMQPLQQEWRDLFAKTCSDYFPSLFVCAVLMQLLSVSILGLSRSCCSYFQTSKKSCMWRLECPLKSPIAVAAAALATYFMRLYNVCSRQFT